MPSGALPLCATTKSAARLAELFLHHRVLIIPIATKGKVHAVVTRNDFFRALVAKLSPDETAP